MLSTEEEWRQCGAFCIKFFDNGKEDFVIIDDYYPFLAEGAEFPFVQTPTGTECWPHILEKAYAKKFGTFEAIEGGFVAGALSELMNGVPETFDFKDNENPQKLWNKCI